MYHCRLKLLIVSIGTIGMATFLLGCEPMQKEKKYDNQIQTTVSSAISKLLAENNFKNE